MGLEFDQSQVKWEYFEMSTLLNVWFNEINIFAHFKISIVTQIIRWFGKNYNANIHYVTFTWSLVLPQMNKIFDILLVLKMITTLNNKDWWHLVVLKWKVKKINQSHYTFVFIHILNFISLISEFYHSSFPSKFFFF